MRRDQDGGLLDGLVGGGGNDDAVDTDGGGDLGDDRGDGGVGMTLMNLIGEVASKTVRLDDGRVQRRSPHDGGTEHTGVEDSGLSGDQANQQNSQLNKEEKVKVLKIII